VHLDVIRLEAAIAADAAVDADLLAGLQIGAGERGAALVSDGGSREVHAVAIAVSGCSALATVAISFPQSVAVTMASKAACWSSTESVPVLDANVRQVERTAGRNRDHQRAERPSSARSNRRRSDREVAAQNERAVASVRVRMLVPSIDTSICSVPARAKALPAARRAALPDPGEEGRRLRGGTEQIDVSIEGTSIRTRTDATGAFVLRGDFAGRSVSCSSVPRTASRPAW